MLDIDVKENWYAFFICIVRGVSIEVGLQMMVDEVFNKVQNKTITDDDVETMIKMKHKGLTYPEIGEIYGITYQAVYRRIKRYKERMVKQHG